MDLLITVKWRQYLRVVPIPFRAGIHRVSFGALSSALHSTTLLLSWPHFSRVIYVHLARFLCRRDSNPRQRANMFSYVQFSRVGLNYDYCFPPLCPVLIVVTSFCNDNFPRAGLGEQQQTRTSTVIVKSCARFFTPCIAARY